MKINYGIVLTGDLEANDVHNGTTLEAVNYALKANFSPEAIQEAFDEDHAARASVIIHILEAVVSGLKAKYETPFAPKEGMA